MHISHVQGQLSVESAQLPLQAHAGLEVRFESPGDHSRVEVLRVLCEADHASLLIKRGMDLASLDLGGGNERVCVCVCECVCVRVTEKKRTMFLTYSSASLTPPRFMRLLTSASERVMKVCRSHDIMSDVTRHHCWGHMIPPTHNSEVT